MRRRIGLGAWLALAGAMALVMPVSAQEAGDGPHPAHIHAGVCPEPGDVVAPLTDVMAGSEVAEGLATAIAVEVSISTVDMALADILAGEHSINVHESADAIDVYIACGDLGGPVMLGTDLAIGLAEQNDSGHAGVAWLHDNGDGTTAVNVFLTGPGEGATTAPQGSPAAEGSPAPVASPATAASPAPPASPASDDGGTDADGGTDVGDGADAEEDPGY